MEITSPRPFGAGTGARRLPWSWRVWAGSLALASLYLYRMGWVVWPHLFESGGGFGGGYRAGGGGVAGGAPRGLPPEGAEIRPPPRDWRGRSRPRAAASPRRHAPPSSPPPHPLGLLAGDAGLPQHLALRLGPARHRPGLPGRRAAPRG